MSEIEIKVRLVRRYIFELKGINIIDIILTTGEDLVKLNYAYSIAHNYFNQENKT